MHRGLWQGRLGGNNPCFTCPCCSTRQHHSPAGTQPGRLCPGWALPHTAQTTRVRWGRKRDKGPGRAQSGAAPSARVCHPAPASQPAFLQQQVSWGFCTAVWGERGGGGRAAPPLCPHVALTELIGFRQPISGFQGFARETHLCTLLPRAAQGRALAAGGTVSQCTPSPESKASCGMAPGTCHRQPSGARGAAQPLRHSQPAAHSPRGLQQWQLRCRPSEPQRLLCSPERPLESVKHFLRSSLPLRAGCNQTACARGQQQRAQSPALSSSSITMLLTTLYPGAGRLSLELCLSHYCASAHFALFTFLLFKEIT